MKIWDGTWDLDGNENYDFDDVQLAIWKDDDRAAELKEKQARGMELTAEEKEFLHPTDIRNRGGWSKIHDMYYWKDHISGKTYGPFKTADELVKAVELDQKFK